jgi:predicted dehydrogenase
MPDQDQLELELTDFLLHVRERSRPAVSGEAGRRALDVALRVVAQIGENRARVEEVLRRSGEADLLGLTGLR